MTTQAIAAGMLVDLVDDPAAVVATAAEAGFTAVGLRVPDEQPTRSTWRDARRALDDTGVELVDLEVLMLRPDDTAAAANARVLAAAETLRPRVVVAASLVPDLGRTAAWLEEIAVALDGTGVRPALEFLPATGVRTLAEARAVVGRLDPGRAVLVVDNLHLARAGEPADAVGTVPVADLGLVQVCDAPAAPPATDPRSLMREAIMGRLLPGEGELPVTSFLAAVPPTAVVSVESLSVWLVSSTSPRARARRAHDALARALARADAVTTDD